MSDKPTCPKCGSSDTADEEITGAGGTLRWVCLRCYHGFWVSAQVPTRLVVAAKDTDAEAQT